MYSQSHFSKVLKIKLKIISYDYKKDCKKSKKMEK